jgi:gamma-glutamyltranspeptidase/glutathione hydrolase
LLRPAIEAAVKGHPISHWSAGQHRQNLEKVSRYPSSVKALLKDGRPHKPGELFVQPDLGRTLEMISREGAETFYRGSIARRVGEFYEEQGGLIRYEDLAAYEAEETAPARIRYKDFDVYGSPPNSQGIVLLMTLKLLEGYDLKRMGHHTAEYAHVLTEALKLAFADRDYYVSDPRVVRDMPVDQLLTAEYAALRRGLIRMDWAIRGAAPPGDPRGRAAVLAGRQVVYETQASTARFVPSESGSADLGGETSSFSIADPFGNLVSVTHSVNGGFGSGLVVEGLGFVLNNRMPYFSLDDGDVNVLAPGKRTRHTINPALAMKDGKPFLAWNTPGGDNQPQAMLQAFLAITEFGMNPQQAVEIPTFTTTSFRASNYPQPAGDELVMPRVLADAVGDRLRARGHKLRVNALQQPYFQAPSGAGAVKMVLIEPGTGVLLGSVSPAKDNYVLGR